MTSMPKPVGTATRFAFAHAIPRVLFRRQAKKGLPLAQIMTDAAVRDDALAILLSAAQAWAAKGVTAVPVAAVWEQLWSVLEEGGVLKKKAK